MIANKNILQPIANYLERELKEELLRQGRQATGELINSIKVVVNQIIEGFEIVGSSVYYGQFVERGRRPGVKGVPIKALLDWIGVKNIKIQGLSDRSVAFMFQASIKRKGIKPSLFVEKTLEKYKGIGSDIEKYMRQHLILTIENMVSQTLSV